MRMADASHGPGITLLPLDSSRIIYVVLSFKTGTTRDPAGRKGLNFITEQIIEETIKRGIDEKAPGSGAVFTARVDKERTTYFFKAHKDTFEQAYPLFISGFVKPRIDSDSLQRARQKASNQREYLMKQSESLSLAALELFIYRDHPYGSPEIGTKKTLETLTIDEVKKFFREFYTSQNYEMGVAATQAERISLKVKKDLADLPPGAPEEMKIGEPEPYRENKVLLIRNESPTTAVALGFPVSFTREDDLFYPLTVFNAAFGQHRYLQGYLFKQLRSTRGFNYGDYSYLEKFMESGQDKMPAVRLPRSRQYFYIWLRNLSDENACFALKFTLYSLQQMTQKGLTEEKFRIMKEFMAHNSMLWPYNPFQKLGFSMDSDFYGTPYFITYLQKKLENMTDNDVSQALKSGLGDRAVKIVMVTRDPGKMKARLLGAIESRPVYKAALPPEDQAVDEKVMNYKAELWEKNIEIREAEELF